MTTIRWKKYGDIAEHTIDLEIEDERDYETAPDHIVHQFFRMQPSDAVFIEVLTPTGPSKEEWILWQVVCVEIPGSPLGYGYRTGMNTREEADALIAKYGVH